MISPVNAYNFKMLCRQITRYALIFCLCSLPLAQAGDIERAQPHRSAIYGEFLGAGLGVMMNYDYLLKDWLSVRGGVGYSFISIPGSDIDKSMNLAVSVSGFYYSQGPHHGELSLGYSVLEAIDDELVPDDLSITAYSLLTGYRYQSRKGGFYARALVGPAVLRLSDRETIKIVLPGFSLGTVF